MPLSIHLVTWNGEQYIPYLFESLRKQTYTNWSLYILDNGSTDQTVQKIKHELATLDVPHSIITRENNIGFAAGHNILFQKSESELQLILNQDMFLEPHCFERLVAFMHSHPDVAAAAPRLMRWDFDQKEQGIEKTLSTNVDALGMTVSRSRRILEQYSGLSWDTLHKKLHTQEDVLSVFGVSGALALYRSAALRSVAFDDRTVLDESYGSYKEDVDLAFRLQSAGHSSAIVLSAAAYHHRSSAGPKSMSDMDAAKNKQEQEQHVRYHSYKNHLMTLYKNEYWQNVVLDLPFILFFEIKKLIWLLCFDRRVLAGIEDIWRMRHKLKKKRAYIFNKRMATYAAIRTWFR